MPGEDPSTLLKPEDIAPKIVALCLPSVTATGMLYDYRAGALQSFRRPA
jgi:hypothetical protein